MNVGALLGAGLPPFGRGVFLSNSVPERGLFQFVVVNGFRTDAETQIVTAKSRGFSVWVFGLPGKWTPANWRASCAQMAALVRRTGIAGFIIDAENEWPSMSRPARQAELVAMGEVIKGLAVDMRIGFCSYPDFPDLEFLYNACGQWCFGSPQLYGQHGESDAVQAQRANRWRRLWGPRIAPCFAAWHLSDRQADAGAYRLYLAGFPHAPAAIAWANPGSTPIYPEVIAGFEPGGSSLGTTSLYFAAMLERPAAAVAAASVAILAFVLVVFAMGVYRVVA